MADAKLNMQPDWEYWAKQIYWNADEAAALSVGIDPDSFKHMAWNEDEYGAKPKIDSVLRKRPPHDAEANKYFQIRESLWKDSSESKHKLIDEKETPVRILEWAENKGFSFPDTLIKAIRQHESKHRKNEPQKLEELAAPPIIKGIDPRQYNSVMKMLLAFLLKHYPGIMQKDDGEHTVGKMIADTAAEYGITVDSKTVAARVTEIKNLPDYQQWARQARQENKK